MNILKRLLVSAFAAELALVGFGRGLYSNAFDARTSRAEVPGKQWYCTHYSTSIPSQLAYSYAQTTTNLTPLSAYADLSKIQDGWTLAVGPEREHGTDFFIRTCTGSDNPCACSSNPKEKWNQYTQGMIVQPLYNAFTHGRMRVAVDMKWPSEVGTTQAQEIRVMLLYDKANPSKTYSFGPSPASFGMVYGNLSCLGRGDFGFRNITTFDRNTWYRLVLDVNLDSVALPINYGDMVLTAYNMGTTQPTLSTPTPATPVGTVNGPLQLSMAENGAVSGIGFISGRATYKTTSSDGTIYPDQCPAIDNLRIWWRPDAGSFDESNLFYENDFATRRVRNVSFGSVAADYASALVTTNSETYVFEPAYAKGQANTTGNLALFTSGKTTGHDDWQSIAYIYSQFSVYDLSEAGGNVLMGVQPPGTPKDYIARFCHPIGTSISSSFVKLEFDIRVPGKQAHYGNGIWANFVALDAGNDFADPVRLGIRSSSWNPSAPVYSPMYREGSDKIDTAHTLKARTWYRARAVLNRNTGLMDCSFYELGGMSGPLDRSVPETAAVTISGKSFDTSKNYSYVGVSGYDFGNDYDSAYIVDNIRIWKGTDGSAWDLVYQNDFNRRVRYGQHVVQEAKLLPEDVNRVGFDGWVRRGAGAGDMYVRNASNPYVTIESEGGFAHAVHTFKARKRKKVTVRADIRPPSRMTNKAEYPGCIYVGGDEYAQGEIGTQAGLHTFTDRALGCFGFARSGNIEKLDFYNHATLFVKDGSGEHLDSADADLASWHRFVATFDLDAKSWRLDVYKQGTAQSAADSADGTLVKSFDGLTFAYDDPTGLSAIGIAGGGTTGDKPLEADKRSVLFDNIKVEVEDSGFLLWME